MPGSASAMGAASTLPPQQQMQQPMMAGGAAGGMASTILTERNQIVAVNQLQRFCNAQSLRALARRLDSVRAHNVLASTGWLVMPVEPALDLSSLALHDIVLSADDSGSMAFEEFCKRFDDLESRFKAAAPADHKDDMRQRITEILATHPWIDAGARVATVMQVGAKLRRSAFSAWKDAMSDSANGFSIFQNLVSASCPQPGILKRGCALMKVCGLTIGYLLMLTSLGVCDARPVGMPPDDSWSQASAAVLRFLGCLEDRHLPANEVTWMIAHSFGTAAQAAIGGQFVAVAFREDGSGRVARFNQLSSTTVLSNALIGCMNRCQDMPERACGLASDTVNSFAVYQNVAHNQTINVVVPLPDNSAADTVKKGIVMFIFSGIVVKILVEVLRWPVWSDCITSCWPRRARTAGSTATPSNNTSGSDESTDEEAGADKME